MNPKFNITIIFLIVFVPNMSFAQIYDCSVDGKTIYQSEPCPEVKHDSTHSTGFGFDGWELGMTIQAVKETARKRQLAMSPGLSTFLTKYNRKILNSKPKARRYTYKTNVLGKLTSVTLEFTKTTRELYKINATFYVVLLKPEERKYFYDSLYASLTEKYGKSELMNNNNSGNLFANTLLGNSHTVWKQSKTNLVSLDYSKTYQSKRVYKLSYINLLLTEDNKKEITNELRKRTNKEISKDVNKL